MRYFLRGCFTGSILVCAISVVALWVCGLAVVGAASWVWGVVYLASTIILCCGVASWLGRPTP